MNTENAENTEATAIAQPLAARLRRLTVGYYSSASAFRNNRPPKPVPYVRLCGKWLKAAGFTIGRHIKVEVIEGRLTIVPTD